MNNRTPVILLISLAALFLAFLCAQKLQTEKIKINPALDKQIISPGYMGFNKFCADLSWMQSLQHRGSFDKLNADLAEILYRRADKLTSLDPFFFEAYGQCALEIAYLKPEKAIQLLEKAMKTGAKCNDFNIPFRAGWIAAYWKEDPELAVKYYEKAKAIPGSPSYLSRLILYQKGKLAKNDPETILQLWYNYLGGSISPEHSAYGQGEQPQKMDSYDTQLALKKINDLADKIIADTKAKLEKTKSAELEKKIAFVQQLVSDATASADRVKEGKGAVNFIVQVKNVRTTLMEPRLGRKGFSLQNNGKKPVYLKLGYGISKNSYGYVLPPNGGSYSAQNYEEIVTAICPDGESEIAVIEIF